MAAVGLVGCAASGTDLSVEGDDASVSADLDSGRRDVSLPSPDALVLDEPSSPDDASPADDAAMPDDASTLDAAPPPPVDASHAPPCAGQPDGFNWFPSDMTARCCGGQPMHEADFTSNASCGACGIACNLANGESCQVLGGRYFCRGCVASADCWSKCCSTSFAPNTCAASDCAGNCDDAVCPTGTHCVAGMGISSDYCAY